MKNVTVSYLDNLIKKVLKEDSTYESGIKYGSKDVPGSSKIKNLQRALGLKSSKTGNPLITGYFGDLTSSALMSKVPEFYKGKNDIIDDRKYNQILQKLGTMTKQTTPTKKQSTPKTAKNLVTSIDFNTLWRNFPRGVKSKDVFPAIFPKLYKEKPQEFGNACATRLSLAMNNVGVRPTPEFVTQNDFVWNGVKYSKKIPITTSAKNTPRYLKAKLGNPTFVGENNQENWNKYLKGKKAIFVITGVPGWRASGHADIVDGTKNNFSCGYACYNGEGGTLQAWIFA